MSKKERKQAARDGGKKEAEAKKVEGQATTEAAKVRLDLSATVILCANILSAHRRNETIT